MATKRARKRDLAMANRAKRRKDVTLPADFRPRFWSDADQRCSIVKLIRKRHAELAQDAGVDCVQKDLLCQRAVFIAIQLETMENNAADTGEFDAGVYTQMSNALSGLLKAIGLSKKAKTVSDLKTYLKERRAS